MTRKNSFAQSAVFITLLTVLQKVFGLIREIVLARCYGTEPITDAFAMSSSASEIVLGCIMAFGVAFLPVYSTTVKSRGIKAGNQFMSSLLTVVAGIGTVVGGIATMLAPQIISLVAPGFFGTTFNLTVLFFRIGIWSILLQAISTIFASNLNYHEAYVRSTAAGLIVSPLQIAVIILSAATNRQILGTSVVFSNFCYAALLYCFVRQYGYHYKPSFAAKAGLRHVFKMVLPIFAGEVISYVNLTIDKIFGSRLDSGSVSALHYAFSIRSLLVTVFTVAITTIVYPVLSKAAAKQDIQEVRNVTCTGVNYIILLFLPLTVAVVLLAEPLLSLLYGGGVFQQESLSMTSGALVFYCVGLLAVALRDFFARVYYSLQQTKVMMAVWSTTAFANIIGDFVMVSRWGINGLALATSISVIAALPVLYIPLNKMLHGINLRASVRIAVKSLFAACVMGGFVLCAARLWFTVAQSGKTALFFYLLFIAIFGAGIYFALIVLLKVQEAIALMNLIKSKLRRAK